MNGSFHDVTPELMVEHGASHGAVWADYDIDGDLDLALANNHDPAGTHPLYVNTLPAERAASSIQVAIVNGESAWNRAGTTVTLRRASDEYVTARVVESGGGYASQSLSPLHFGLPPGEGPLSLTITWFEEGEARASTVSGIDPARFRGRWLTLQLGLR